MTEKYWKHSSLPQPSERTLIHKINQAFMRYIASLCEPAEIKVNNRSFIQHMRYCALYFIDHDEATVGRLHTSEGYKRQFPASIKVLRWCILFHYAVSHLRAVVSRWLRHQQADICTLLYFIHVVLAASKRINFPRINSETQCCSFVLAETIVGAGVRIVIQHISVKKEE